MKTVSQLPLLDLPPLPLSLSAPVSLEVICLIHAGHPRIIHRDIKAANILLDYSFEAMVFRQQISSV
jgi:serine/threonine protein kinase